MPRPPVERVDQPGGRGPAGTYEGGTPAPDPRVRGGGSTGRPLPLEDRPGSPHRPQPPRVSSWRTDAEHTKGARRVRRSDGLPIWAFATLTAAALAAVFVLALLGAPGWVIFVVVIALFATIWIGAFWLVVPSDRDERRDAE